MIKIQNALQRRYAPNDLTRSTTLTGSRLAAYGITAGTCVYGLLIGGPFEGVINPTTRTWSMLLLTMLCGIWCIERLIRRVPYRLSFIDAIAAAWIAVIGVAWLANGLDNRRSWIGAWYDALALLTVVIVADLIRRGLPRRWLADGVLLAGGYAILVAYEQMWGWFTGWFSVRGTGVAFLPLRPPGTLGNPNSLATALTVVILLAFPRVWGRSLLIVRLGWGLYVLLAGGLLLLTESKGAWIGLIVGFIALGIFAWRTSDVRISLRQAAKIAGGGIIIGSVLFIFVGLPLLVAGARADGRLGIYAIALKAFIERPMTGHGPDSFSLQLMTNQSIPPQPPHSHAHDVPLHVAAELGLGGLVALALTCVGGLYLFWQILTRVSPDERPVLIVIGASCMAIAGHSLFDVTATQPAQFLLDAMLFAAAVTMQSASSPETVRRTMLPVLRPGTFGLNGVALLFVLIGGWWGTIVYWPYYNGVAAAAPGNYHQAAALLDEAAALDPKSPIAWAAAGYMHGLAALVDKNFADLPYAIDCYEKAVALEPPSSINWLNLAALYSQAGRSEEAINAAAQATRYAPDDPIFTVNQGIILEKFRHDNEARASYDAALHLLPQLSGELFWQQTDFRRSVAERYPQLPSTTQQLLALIASGNIVAARAQVSTEKAENALDPQVFVDAALLEIRSRGNLNVAARDLAAAQTLFDPLSNNWAWIHEGLAELDAARGDQAGHDRDIALIQQPPRQNVDGTSIPYGVSIPIGIYYVASVPRALLPIVWYPTVPPDLQRLLAESAPF